MAAYRATRHDATGYSPNFLVLHREVRVPVDLMYEAPPEKPTEDYDDFVEKIRERTTTAYAKVRQQLRRSAERNKRYYDIGLTPKRFAPGQWVLYFNPRKLRGKQMKWQRQYEGPYLVVETPSTLTAKIQRNPKSQPKVVHIDKLREYPGAPPRSWLTNQVRGALPSTPKSPVSTTTHELPQTTGQPQSPLQVVSSPATEHSAMVDLVSESMNDNELFSRIGNRTDPERPLTSLTASHVQQAQSGNERQPVEGLISDNVLTSTSSEKPQQGSQMSSALEGSDVRPNLATSSFDCMDDQTQSIRVSHEGFLTSLDERDSTSITQKGVNEKSRVRHRCFVGNDQIVDKSTQTSCKDSNVVSVSYTHLTLPTNREV